MDKTVDVVPLPKTNLLFAHHHGRKSGKTPSAWIANMDPDIIIMGEADSCDSDYSSYLGYNRIRQNSAKDITFEYIDSKIRCYSSNPHYFADFFDRKDVDSLRYNYIGALKV